jgi:predicted TPR repeat methyltransferase
MNEWDARAKEWDAEKVHMDRSLAVAQELENIIPAEGLQRALEYGAGTGILSFLLKDRFQEIVLMDSSREMIKVCEEKAGYFSVLSDSVCSCLSKASIAPT